MGDFGVSRILSTNSLDASSIVGTQAYCSPQILLDQRYSYKADVWSSGCVLFELASLETFSLYRMKENLIFILLIEVVILASRVVTDLQQSKRLIILRQKLVFKK